MKSIGLILLLELAGCTYIELHGNNNSLYRVGAEIGEIQISHSPLTTSKTDDSVKGLHPQIPDSNEVHH